MCKVLSIHPATLRIANTFKQNCLTSDEKPIHKTKAVQPHTVFPKHRPITRTVITQHDIMGKNKTIIPVTKYTPKSTRQTSLQSFIFVWFALDQVLRVCPTETW